MATRVRLTADVHPDVKRRVRIAAIESDTSVSEWVERAVVDALARVERDPPPAEDGVVYPASGARLTPLRDPPKLRDGSKMSDTIIEDRR